jgi:hypothetical protein
LAFAKARANASLRSAAFGCETRRSTFFGAGFFRATPGFDFFFFIGSIKASPAVPEKTFVLDFLNGKIDQKQLMETPPKEKELETVSFVVHATRGVLRDQKTRRKAMIFCLALAVLMLLAGFTVFQTVLNPREHPWFVILFWIACVWLTFTAMLLAIFDLLIIRAETRRTQRALREKMNAESSGK